MCLAVPMQVKELDENMARVEVGGTVQHVRLDLLGEPPELGDYVIVHAGFALQKLDREEALETLKLFQEGLNLELV